MQAGSQYDVTRCYRANVSVYKIVSLHRQECDCSSELLRCNASDAGIKFIPVFQHNVIV